MPRCFVLDLGPNLDQFALGLHATQGLITISTRGEFEMGSLQTENAVAVESGKKPAVESGGKPEDSFGPGKAQEPDWIHEIRTGDPNKSSDIGKTDGLPETVAKSVKDLGLARNPEKERKLAEEMVKLYDQNPKSMDGKWREAFGEAGMWKQVSLGEAHITYDRVVELSKPDGNTKTGWQKYDQMKDALATAMKEPLKDENSRKNATEKFVEALNVNDRIGPQMIREATSNYEMLAELGSSYGKNLKNVRENAASVAAIQKENGASFSDAYTTQTSVNALVAKAHEHLKSEKGQDLAIKTLKESLKLSPGATERKLGAGDVPLTETEIGSKFYIALKAAIEER